jgi:sRNA-binding carbon storage regulator CsrA
MEELAEGQVRRGPCAVMDYGRSSTWAAWTAYSTSARSVSGRRKPSEFVKIGDVIDVKILRIDRESRKLSLSLKSAASIRGRRRDKIRRRIRSPAG